MCVTPKAYHSTGSRPSSGSSWRVQTARPLHAWLCMQCMPAGKRCASLCGVTHRLRVAKAARRATALCGAAMRRALEPGFSATVDTLGNLLVRAL